MRRTVLVWGFFALGAVAAPAFAVDTVYYYSSDTLHSEVVVTDQNRDVVERTYYAPYGAVLNRDLRDGPGYTGHEEDPETNLVYMQQRYYDPEAGRFLSTDPVQADGNGASFNRYEYANDNPYRYTDPFGMCTGSHITSKDGRNCASTGGDTTGTNGAMQGMMRAQAAARSRAASTGSTSSGAIQPAIPPTNPKIEASGFSSDLAAATAAGNAYGAEGTANQQEVELGLLQIHAGDWGYLTPGWGPVGATLVDPTPVLQAYINAGLSVNEWMHGHFDGQLGFSATDFGLVYGRPASYRTFIVNAHGETRWMGYGDLLQHRSELTPDEAIRGLQGYQELLPNGLPGH